MSSLAVTARTTRVVRRPRAKAQTNFKKVSTRMKKPNRTKGRRSRVDSRPTALIKNVQFGRDALYQDRANVSWSKAPDHPDYGPGDRVTVTCTPYVVGRTGDTYNAANQLLKFSFGTTSAYGKSVAFGPIWAPNSATGCANCLCAYGSTYTTNGASAINRATAELQFYNMLAVRSVKVSYSPTCNTITTTGNITFAPQYTDPDTNFIDGSHLDMKNYSDVSSMPGSMRTPVVKAASFYLKKMIKPDLPSSEFAETDVNSGFATTRMLCACDTQLGAGTSDTLGELSFELVIDCYGAQWNPPLALSATAASPECRKDREISDLVKRELGKMLGPVELDKKEAKDEKKSEEMSEWERIEAQESLKRIVDQRAYRTAVANALRSESTSSTAVQAATSTTSPNTLGRPKL